MKTKKQLREQPLAAALATAQGEKRPGALIDKQITLFHAKGSSDEAMKAAGAVSGVLRPTDEQLKRINMFTKSPKTADEVVVFTTLSANDLPDRDDDAFTTETVKAFAALPEPYGPVGKSYMVGHDYSKLPVGRIFGAGLTEIDGATFLTNEIYIPNTESNKSFIENVDFGVNWAVSVGVMLEAMNCSICNKTMYNFWGMGMCDEGHFKGAYYDPKSDETDAGGYPLERRPDDPGAVKCLGMMEGAKDFYELSQVFLGAQFYASVDKSSKMEGVLKAASASKVPLIGLSADESEGLPFARSVPLAVRQAMAAGIVETDEDGRMKWVDSESLVWVFTPGENESPLCLGKEASGEEAEPEDDEDVTAENGGESADESAEEVDGDGEGREGSEDSGDRVGESQDDAVGEPGSDEVGEEPVGDPEQEGLTDEDDDSSDSEKGAVITGVIAAAVKCKAPESWIEAAQKAPEQEAFTALLSAAVAENNSLREKISSDEPFVELGMSQIKSLRAEAINWFVKANQSTSTEGVDIAPFEKLLDACGQDTELIGTLLGQQKTMALSKMPKTVRRSSAPADPNEKTVAELPDVEHYTGKQSDEKVRRFHG